MFDAIEVCSVFPEVLQWVLGCPLTSLGQCMLQPCWSRRWALRPSRTNTCLVVSFGPVLQGEVQPSTSNVWDYHCSYKQISINASKDSATDRPSKIKRLAPCTGPATQHRRSGLAAAPRRRRLLVPLAFCCIWIHLKGGQRQPAPPAAAHHKQRLFHGARAPEAAAGQPPHVQHGYSTAGGAVRVHACGGD